MTLTRFFTDEQDEAASPPAPAPRPSPSLWSEVAFGKCRGNSLPWILVHEPIWFRWATRESIFKGPLAQEASLLAQRAQRIKLPVAYAGSHQVTYFITPQRKLTALRLTKIGSRPYDNPDLEIREDYLNLFIGGGANDKTGYGYLVAFLRKHWFSGNKLTQGRLEEFFGDLANFQGS